MASATAPFSQNPSDTSPENVWVGDSAAKKGILLTRLQGTVFENFILPVIDTKVLLKPNGKTP